MLIKQGIITAVLSFSAFIVPISFHTSPLVDVEILPFFMVLHIKLYVPVASIKNMLLQYLMNFV